MTLGNWYWALGGGAMCVAFISWIAFARISMARIERRIVDDGEPRPCPWDGPGIRVIWYAWAITVPVGRFNPLDDPLMDVQGVRRHALARDRILGWTLMISGYALVSFAIVGAAISYLQDAG